MIYFVLDYLRFMKKIRNSISFLDDGCDELRRADK